MEALEEVMSVIGPLAKIKLISIENRLTKILGINRATIYRILNEDAAADAPPSG